MFINHWSQKNVAFSYSQSYNEARRMAIIYTKHAKEMLAHRNIKIELADKCANNPDQILLGENDRKIYLKESGSKIPIQWK